MAAGRKTGGRKKGTPNKSTEAVREAIAKFANGNIERLEGWLEDIAADDPVKAADLFLKVLEYYIPKLSRSEITGELDVKTSVINAQPEMTTEKWLDQSSGRHSPDHKPH